MQVERIERRAAAISSGLARSMHVDSVQFAMGLVDREIAAFNDDLNGVTELVEPQQSVLQKLYAEAGI